jgi:DNA-binding response OmpR family regulator
LLNIGLPDGEGFGVLEYLGSKQKNEAVLIISARNSLDDKLKSLNVGADDYLTKLFHLAELKARLMAVYRRKAFDTNNKLVFNEISIDMQGRTVEINQTPIILTRKEYDMLGLLRRYSYVGNPCCGIYFTGTFTGFKNKSY